MNSIFIPSEKLGVLEALIRAAGEEQTRRKRANRHRELAGLLHRLGLLPPGEPIAIGLGCNTSGDHGALVLIDPPTVVVPASGVTP